MLSIRYLEPFLQRYDERKPNAVAKKALAKKNELEEQESMSTKMVERLTGEGG
jgi:hypothetical protein